MAHGQTIPEIITALQILEGQGLIFTDYKMNALAPDGSKLELKYAVKNDYRFNDAKAQG